MHRAADYRTVIVARRAAPLSELAGRVAAVNAADSLSGWVSLLAAFRSAGAPWHGSVITTGAHVRSIDAVREGSADVASIDAVTFALLGDLHPEQRPRAHGDRAGAAGAVPAVDRPRHGD